MTDHERQKLWYARQKLWEAVQCLVGPKKFRDRLVAAAAPLVQLKHQHPREVDRLPEGVRGKFDDVVHMLTKHRAEFEHSDYDSGIITSVGRLTPQQRAEIAADILSMFVTLSGGI
jgi:hypothetical protein